MTLELKIPSICRKIPSVALVVGANLLGCSGSSTETKETQSAGGAADGSSTTSQGSVGGEATVTKGSGGILANGGSASGGSKALGGSVTAGGSAATGGKPTIGGSAATGGKPTIGGSGSGGKALGGNATTGGSVSTGGKTASGGSASGGKAANGGTGSGGKAMGGNATTGGSIATGGKTATGGSTGTGGSPILEPATGALLGLYYGDASLDATAQKLGRTLPLHLTYYAWEDDWTTEITTADLRAGRIPFVNWELFGGVLDDIIAGKDDAMIAARAVSAKNLGKKLFVDFGAEMNGDWSPWGGAQNGKSATKFVDAYRHVHDIFVKNGATNVIWAFCPNVTSVPDESWNEPLDYYPGDSYVDWMCVDGYNWGTSSSGDSWQSFSNVFSEIYAVLATKKKPIIIGEMASAEVGGNKAAWIGQIVPALKTEFPLIKGLLWFDINKETDWRISSSQASEAAFKTMANDAWFIQ
jgi:hypothetical protein